MTEKRLCLAVICVALVVAPARAQDPPHNEAVRVEQLWRIFNDLYGPEGPGRGQHGVARRRAVALGPLQRRLRERVLAVRRRAHQPAGVAAAAGAGGRLHLRVRPGPRHLQPHHQQLRPDHVRARRDHRRPPAVGGLCHPAPRVRPHRRPRPEPHPGGVQPRQRRAARRPRGRRHDGELGGEPASRARRCS